MDSDNLQSVDLRIPDQIINKTKIGDDPIVQEIRKRRVDMEIRLRVSGFSYREIVEAVKQQFDPNHLPAQYSESTISQDISRVYKRMDELDRETLRVARRMDLQRLDSMMMVTFNRALGGDLKAVKATLEIMERRSKLLGLDKPTTVQVKDWRSEILDLIRSGKVTIDDVKREFGTQIAREIIESGGETVIESYFAESEDDSGNADGNVPGQDAKDMAPRLPALGQWASDQVPQGTGTVLGEQIPLDDHGGGIAGG